VQKGFLPVGSRSPRDPTNTAVKERLEGRLWSGEREAPVLPRILPRSPACNQRGFFYVGARPMINATEAA
jgi:hypothetical protein